MHPHTKKHQPHFPPPLYTDIDTDTDTDTPPT